MQTNLNPMNSDFVVGMKRTRGNINIDVIRSAKSKNTAKGNRIIQRTFIFSFLSFFIFLTFFSCFHLTVSGTRRAIWQVISDAYYNICLI